MQNATTEAATEHAKEIYRRLWQTIRDHASEPALGYRVAGYFPKHAQGMAGYFEAPRVDGACPRIAIMRDSEPPAPCLPGDPYPDEDVHIELPVLAHEFGHLLSWFEDGTRYKAVQAAKVPFETAEAAGERMTLTEEQATLIREEELRAWSNGRKVLHELGYADWTTFDAQQADALGIYRSKMGSEASQ